MFEVRRVLGWRVVVGISLVFCSMEVLVADVGHTMTLRDPKGPSSVFAEVAITVCIVPSEATNGDDQTDDHDRSHDPCHVYILYLHVFSLTHLGRPHFVGCQTAVLSRVASRHRLKLIASVE